MTAPAATAASARPAVRAPGSTTPPGTVRATAIDCAIVGPRQTRAARYRSDARSPSIRGAADRIRCASSATSARSRGTQSRAPSRGPVAVPSSTSPPVRPLAPEPIRSASNNAVWTPAARQMVRRRHARQAAADNRDVDLGRQCTRRVEAPDSPRRYSPIASRLLRYHPSMDVYRIIVRGSSVLGGLAQLPAQQRRATALPLDASGPAGSTTTAATSGGGGATSTTTSGCPGRVRQTPRPGAARPWRRIQRTRSAAATRLAAIP